MSPTLRYAVVTGASTGIGRACALDLSRSGFHVFAGVRRSQDGESLRAEAGERVEPLPIDVTDGAAIEAAAKTVAEATGDSGLQGLVNNAGIAVGGVLEFQDPDALRRQLEVNVVGPVAVTRAFLPLLRRGQGRIVNMSSNGGYVAAPLLGPYAASKFALEALSDSLRRELRRWRIPVAVIEPGSIDTPIWDKARPHTQDLAEGLPAAGRELYAEVFDKMEAYVESTSKRAIPAQRVADAVRHALTAARPRTRYRVGADAKAVWWLSRFLPDRALDAILARLTGV